MVKSPAIANVLHTFLKPREQGLAIDNLDRVWLCTPNHTGYILTGQNQEGFIPTPSSNLISLDGLKRFSGPHLPQPKAERQTLSDVIGLYDQCSRFMDDSGVVWASKKYEFEEGFELHVLTEDTGWLPWRTCKVLWMPGFRILQTQEQVKARRVEWVGVPPEYH
jgi:hypothetical protein